MSIGWKSKNAKDMFSLMEILKQWSGPALLKMTIFINLVD